MSRLPGQQEIPDSALAPQRAVGVAAVPQPLQLLRPHHQPRHLQPGLSTVRQDSREQPTSPASWRTATHTASNPALVSAVGELKWDQNCGTTSSLQKYNHCLTSTPNYFNEATSGSKQPEDYIVRIHHEILHKLCHLYVSLQEDEAGLAEG